MCLCVCVCVSLCTAIFPACTSMETIVLYMCKSSQYSGRHKQDPCKLAGTNAFLREIPTSRLAIPARRRLFLACTACRSRVLFHEYGNQFTIAYEISLRLELLLELVITFLNGSTLEFTISS